MTLGRDTLGELLDKARRQCQVGPGNQRVNGLLKDAINASLHELVTMREWSDLERSDDIGLRKGDDGTTLTFEGTESQAPMPLDSLKITSLQTYSPSYSVVEIIQPQEIYKRLRASTTLTGVPRFAAPVGRTAQHVALAADSVLTLKCDDTGNDDVRTVRVSYRRNDAQIGNPTYKDFTGTFSGSGLSTGFTAESGWPVDSVYIPAGWVGNLTIEDASANVIVDIDPIEDPGTVSNSKARYVSRLLLRVAPIPDVDYRASISYRLNPPKLVDTGDVCPIPVGDVLVSRAVASYYRSERKASLAREHEAISERLLRAIQNNEQRANPSVRPRGGSIRGMTGSWGR